MVCNFGKASAGYTPIPLFGFGIPPKRKPSILVEVLIELKY